MWAKALPKSGSQNKFKNKKLRSLFSLVKQHGQGRYQNWAALDCRLTQAQPLDANGAIAMCIDQDSKNKIQGRH
jgi:hypothetical protein